MSGAFNAEFDNEYYLGVNRAREAVLDTIVPPLIARLGLASAVDVGAGLGYFSRYLSDKGLRVTAVDGREENIDALKARVPEATALVGDVEELHHLDLGRFDLVLCAGLLYHVENPFRAVRNLHGLSGKACVVESRVHWATDPVALCVREASGASQALRGLALLPTRRCLINMMYNAGFSHVYSVRFRSPHAELSRSSFRAPRRHFFVASRQGLEGVPCLSLEPTSDGADMSTSTPYRRSLRRLVRAGRDLIPWLFQPGGGDGAP